MQDIRIGEMIEIARIKKGYSRLELSRISKISASDLAKIESSLYDPPFSKMLKLFNILDIKFELKGSIKINESK